MYVKMVGGKLKPSKWGEYEKWYNDNVEPATKHQKGFVSRQLLRSTENLDEGVSITVWETRDDMENYDLSPERQRYTREMEPLYTGEYWVKKYEIRASL